MDSTIDRLYDQNNALKATLRGALNALKLVKMLHDNPDSLSFLGHSVKLDPKAYEQVKHAIMNTEDVLS